MSGERCAKCASTAVVKKGKLFAGTPIETDRWVCLNCEIMKMKAGGEQVETA